MTMIKNPVLRGFHPDPSVLRVGRDYYVANSTFEWWPGVRLHHSTDLVHWELIGSPLDRVSQLDLRGVGASQGVWASDLSYCDGIYYLVYTVVTSFYCNMYDTHNYLVTAEDIHGPWSEPVSLSSYGFDPSMFHDDDGRKYFVSMVTDHRIPPRYKGRLILQEYDAARRQMKGSGTDIFRADTFYLEGPHIYKHNGLYYLMAADTGTGEGHGESILRSEKIEGPYECCSPAADPKLRKDGNRACSFMTARDDPDWPLQKTGHGSLVETPEGEWYMFYLCGRPMKNRNPGTAVKFPGERRYMLGRETAVQKVEWTADGWLQLAGGSILPDVTTEVHTDGDTLPEAPAGLIVEKDSGRGPELNPEFQSLRLPMTEDYLSLIARPGYLRLFGHDGLSSKFGQALVARRLTEYRAEAETKLDFDPLNYKQMAGLIVMYDTDNYFYLHVTQDEEIGKCIGILTAENGKYKYPAGLQPIEKKGSVRLKVTVREDALRFFYAAEGEDYTAIGDQFDCSVLSDEACREGWFTGTMVGICCQDLTGSRNHADFREFRYRAEGVNENQAGMQ